MVEPTPPSVVDPTDLERRRALIAGQLFGARPRDAATIGRYTVLRRLGAGGMAVVYAAYDESLDRKVAVKLLRATSTEPDAKRESRFTSEAKAMARVTHANVATVFENGMHTPAQGPPHPFIAIEFVDGDNLREWLGQERTTTEVLAVMYQAGVGLAAVHKAGLVHRDLKPENVMVGYDGVVKVVDFGVAALVDSRGPALDDAVTSDVAAPGPNDRGTFDIGGTPAYMAPEQLRGLIADARSDQYSFCVTLFEALVGHRPYQAQSVRELLHAMEHAPIGPIPELPAAVGDALRRGVAFAAQDRFDSMEDLVQRLAPATRGSARTPTVVVAVLGGIGIGAFGLASLAADDEGGCTSDRLVTEQVWTKARQRQLHARFNEADAPEYLRQTWPRVRTRVETLVQSHADARGRLCRTAGPEALRATPESQCLAGTQADLDATVQSLLSTDRVGLERAVDIVAALSDPARCLEAARGEGLRSGDVPESVALQLAQARAHLLATDRVAARAALEQSGALDPASRGRVAVLGHTLAAEVALADADYALVQRHHRLAREALQQSNADDLRVALAAVQLASMAAQHSPDAAGFADGVLEATASGAVRLETQARVVTLRAAVALDAGRFADATKAATEAVRLGEALPPRTRGEAMDILARVHLGAGRYEEALGVATRALMLRREVYGEQHPDVATSTGTVGAIDLRLGRWSDARDRLQDARDLFVAAYGPLHPEVARTRANLGSALRELADNDAALREYVAARQIFETVHGPQDSRVAAVLLNEAAMQHEFGDFESARQGYARVLQIQGTRLAPDHPHVMAARANLGQLQADLGEYEAAAVTLRAVLDSRARTLGNEHSDVAKAALELGHVVLAMGRTGEAVRLYERALQIDRAALGPVHYRIAEDLAALVTALGRHGDRTRAANLAVQVTASRGDHDSAAARTSDQRAYLGHLKAAGRAPQRAMLLAERVAQLELPTVEPDPSP